MNIGAWISGHHTQAAGAAGAGLVVVYALYKRHQANTTTGAGTSASTAATQAAAVLPGTPDTTATDTQNAVQDEINTDVAGLQTQFQQAIARIPAGPAGPAGKPASTASITAATKTALASISKARDSAVAAVKKTTPARPAAKKVTPARPAAKPAVKRTSTQQYYTVRSGDNLTKIANKYGMSLASIEKLNPMPNFNLIHPGQKIKV